VRFSILLFFALSVAFLEAGLQLRTLIDEEFSPRFLPAIAKKNVLLIGDSILGLNEKNTAAGYIQKEVMEKSPGVSVVNLCFPANNSNRVVILINEYLEKYKPGAVVLLLGKSDSPSVDTTDPEPKPNFLFTHFKVLRLSWLLQQKMWSVYHRTRFGASLLLSRLAPFSAPNSVDLHAEFSTLEELESTKNFGDYDAELNRLHESGSFAEACNASATLALLKIRMGKGALSESYLREAEACMETLESKKPQYNWLMARLGSLIGSTYKEIGDQDKAEYFFRQAVVAMPEFGRTYSDLGWMYYNTDNCASAIAPLEKALEIGDHWTTSITALYRCYMRQSKFEEGAKYFKTLAMNSSNAELLLKLAHILEKQKTSNFSQQIIGFEKTPTNREDYMAALWMYERFDRPDPANALFKDLDRFGFANLQLNHHLYEEIAKRILEQNVSLILLQYPNNSDDEFFHQLAGSDKRIHLVNIHSLLRAEVGVKKDHQTKNVFDFFDPDFEHLSDEGARLTAKEISQEIMKVL
jgi:Tfp pilus assembly protein PilF